jgi:hypothetical protein
MRITLPFGRDVTVAPFSCARAPVYHSHAHHPQAHHHSHTRNTHEMAVKSKPSSTLAQLQTFASSTKEHITQNATSTLASAQIVMQKYPPVKAFVYALAGASALPLAVFAGFVAVTAAVVLGVAGGSRVRVRALSRVVPIPRC